MAKETALNYAKQYCDMHGLSFNKLSNLTYLQLSDQGAFCGEPDEEGRGLTNDIASQYKPILFVEPTGNISETRFTTQFLR
jgi:hypothetical protein